MTSMIERVARAIYEGRNGHGCKPWGNLTNDHKDPYIKDAKVAIPAMKEPTPEMLNAAYECTVCGCCTMSVEAANDVWIEMIGAAEDGK